MKLWRAVILAAALVAAVFGAVHFLGSHPGGARSGVLSAVAWQRMARPGALSRQHAFLEHNCVACHTPNKGVEAENCIVCHANDLSLLQRQPTAFHAEVRSCVECHAEHEGRNLRPPKMDHAALAKLGLRQMKVSSGADRATQLTAWIGKHSGGASLPAGRTAPPFEESALNCMTCHANQDRHRALFGNDCVQCHTTEAWTVSGYRHPAPTSKSCAECHQAPPSHYMMHFKMISVTVAHQPFARVEQCYLCHQTTSWNDIRGVGWYKHH